MIGALAALFFTNHSVELQPDSGLYWTVEVVNHTKSTQPNPPITELNTITIAKATYPTKNLGISKMEKFFFNLDIVSTGDIRHKCINCFQKLKWL